MPLINTKIRNKYKRLLILCRGNSVTGGSELVHQLSHELTSLNFDSSIVYYPFHTKFSVPEEYRIYKVKQSNFDDSKDFKAFQNDYESHKLTYKTRFSRNYA